MPGSENAGSDEPTASVGGCSDANDAPANASRNVTKTERMIAPFERGREYGTTSNCETGITAQPRQARPLLLANQECPHSDEPEAGVREVADVGKDPWQFRGRTAEPARQGGGEL